MGLLLDRVRPDLVEFAESQPLWFVASAPLAGYGVPQMDFVSERGMLEDWAERKGAEGVATCQAEKNTSSIDGLPGLVGQA